MAMQISIDLEQRSLRPDIARPARWKWEGLVPFRGRVTDNEKQEFCSQLSVLLQSKVSLQKSLEILASQARGDSMRSVLKQLVRDVQRGSSFSRALQAHPLTFDNLFVVTAEVGQESGYLGPVLGQLGVYLDKIGALKRKFMQALTYPLLVIGVAVCAVLFLMVFIVPTFAEMFSTLQVELPASTRFVLSASEFMTEWGTYILIVLIIVAIMIRRQILSPSMREKAMEKLFRVPLIGKVLVENHVARFCRTLGTLLRAQVTLVDALHVTQKIASTPNIRREIEKITRHVKQGKAIADQMLGSSVFPPMVAHMIAVGEETSELDDMLLRVAEHYDKGLDARIEKLSSIIEPVIILMLGFLVASILISMYLPMFDLVNVVGAG